MMRRSYVVVAAVLLQSTGAWCAETAKEKPEWKPSLLADEAPAQKPWEDGATFAYKSVDGKASAIADAVFKLERIEDRKVTGGFSRVSWGPGVYVHRNSDAAKPNNDRGLMLSVAGLWFDDGPADGARKSWSWSVEAKGGRKLTTEDVAGKKAYYDKDSRRVTAGGQFVYAPSAGQLDPSNLKQQAFMFFTASAKLYLDRVSGGVTSASGRITGVEAMARFDIAPLGLDPSVTKVNKTGLGFVPSFAVWGQRQQDFSASGARARENRNLWGAKAQMTFSQLDGSGVVPALSLERTKGADLLTGREDSDVTKLSLTIKY
ncbi:hypothetical protein [Roseateles sp.]|uniref:hypothetical protein n=1 Tax=Roseateles sp. TaxID=1971397 RepID=UPI003D130A07